MEHRREIRNDNFLDILAGKDKDKEWSWVVNPGYSFNHHENEKKFNKIKFIEEININEALTYKQVTFENCTFTRTLYVSNEQECSIKFQKCHFEKDIYFEKGIFKGDISFILCELNGDLNLINESYNQLILSEFYGGSIIIKTNGIESLSLNGKERDQRSVMKIVQISLVGVKRFEISDIAFHMLEINGIIEKGSICSIKSIVTEFFCLRDLIVEGSFIISDILSRKVSKSDSHFLISRSNLGKTEIYNIDLRKFKIVQIYRSVLTDCIFANIKWPKKIVSLKPGKDIKHDNSDDQKEIYRQLKYALSKQGNSYDEQIFHGKELNSIYKSLSFKADFWTKLVLRLSYISSNYGRSILLPIVCIIIGNGLLLWWLYALEMYYSSPITVAWKSGKFENVLGVLVHYSNPLHKFDESFRGWQIIADALMRIISSYSIYNFIRASRRFIK